MERIFPALMLAVTVVATAELGVSRGVWAQTPFDGSWSVLIMTERGKCDPAYRYAVDIRDGDLVYAGDSAFDIHGKVSHDGQIQVRVVYGSQNAAGSGHLSTKSGTGTWQGTGSTGICGGRWTAERR